MTKSHPVQGFQKHSRERAALVGLARDAASKWQAGRTMDELSGLARAAGAEVVLRVLQERQKPESATFLGRGKVETLAVACAELGVDVVIFDNELSPAQLRNLENAVSCKIVDRTQLILDIFARRARTREGKLQVELAQLKYLLPRLVGASTALSRPGGGIGTRGPGETKLETDRRRIRHRIAALAREIETVRRRRARSRDRRRKASVPVVALVGYTNAGKTTLFNLLTGHNAEVSNALFVTLDPLVRQVRLPDRREILLSDTVGFIERLPHALVAAFHATLEEVAGADLLVHVIDASSPDHEYQMVAVGRVLEDVGACEVPRLDVFNKCDLLDAAEIERLKTANSTALFLSALTGEGRRELIAAIARRLALDTRHVSLEFDEGSDADRRRIERLYRHGHVLRHVSRNGRVSIEADVPWRVLERLGVIHDGRA